jgi:hypothetical protein
MEKSLLPWQARQFWTFSETEDGAAIAVIGRDSKSKATVKAKPKLVLIIVSLLTSFSPRYLCPVIQPG